MSAAHCMGVEGEGLKFLWLELTSRCNLRYTHCYSESGPHPDMNDLLTEAEYRKLISSAAELGCKRIQFIGGEPTLVPELPNFIAHARIKGFEFVEVYTNATRISDDLLACFVAYEVAAATSFYADDPEIHDAITGRKKSYAATVRTIQRFLDVGLDTRRSCGDGPESRSHRTDERISALLGRGEYSY